MMPPMLVAGRGGAVVCPGRKPKGQRSRLTAVFNSPVTRVALRRARRIREFELVRLQETAAAAKRAGSHRARGGDRDEAETES
jgi:hypothetical protein